MTMKLLHQEIFSWRGGHSSFRLEQMEVGGGSEFLEVHGPLPPGPQNDIPMFQDLRSTLHHIQERNTI